MKKIHKDKKFIIKCGYCGKEFERLHPCSQYCNKECSKKVRQLLRKLEHLKFKYKNKIIKITIKEFQNKYINSKQCLKCNKPLLNIERNTVRVNSNNDIITISDIDFVHKDCTVVENFCERCYKQYFGKESSRYCPDCILLNIKEKRDRKKEQKKEQKKIVELNKKNHKCEICGNKLKYPRKECGDCKALRKKIQRCANITIFLTRRKCQFCGKDMLNSRRSRVCSSAKCITIRQNYYYEKNKYKNKEPTGKALLTYRGIIQRCNNVNNHNYERYGAKGVEVKITQDRYIELNISAIHCNICEREFINNDPYLNKTTDRIDGKGDYEEENIQFLCNLCNSLKTTKHKFKEKDIKEIREMYETGEYTYTEIARVKKTNRGTISDIIRYKTWRHI